MEVNADVLLKWMKRKPDLCCAPPPKSIPRMGQTINEPVAGFFLKEKFDNLSS